MDADLKAYLDEMKRELRADIEKTETKLLRAFHDWASPLEMRIRSHSAAMRAMDLEIEAMGDRIEKLEPPH